MENSQDISLTLNPPFSSSKTTLLTSSLFIAAAIIRLAYVYLSPSPSANIWSDMQGYNYISDEILKGHWSENHFFQSIGYPLFLSAVKYMFSNWGKALGYIQAILSFYTIVLVYKSVLQSMGQKIAIITLIATTLHVPWILFNGVILPETLFTFLMALCAWSMVKIFSEDKPSFIYQITWATSFIVAFWLKGTHVFWAPLFLTGYFFYKKKSLKICLPAVAILLAGLTIHGAFTQSKIGKIQLSASTGGLNFIEGKCPYKNNKDSAGYAWHSPLYYQLDMHQQKVWPRPFTDSSYFMKEGFNCINEKPSVLIQSLEGINFLFIGNTLWPFNQFKFSGMLRLYEQIFSFVVITGLILFGFWLVQTKDVKTIFVWVLPVLSLFMCVYIFKSEIRYRIPFDVWLIPISIHGWVNFLEMRKRGQYASVSSGAVF